MGGGNPICHIDIAPWGEEIATNLQLLQDRMKTETCVLFLVTLFSLQRLTTSGIRWLVCWL